MEPPPTASPATTTHKETHDHERTSPPTLEELHAELALLQAELDSTRKLGNDRASRGYHLQSVQTNVILGRATTSELEAARLAQDESVAALLRIPLLEQAVGDARQRIDDAQHRARVQHIENIRERSSRPTTSTSSSRSAPSSCSASCSGWTRSSGASAVAPRRTCSTCWIRTNASFICLPSAAVSPAGSNISTGQE